MTESQKIKALQHPAQGNEITQKIQNSGIKTTLFSLMIFPLLGRLGERRIQPLD